MQLLIIAGAGLLGLIIFNKKTETNMKYFPVSYFKKGRCFLTYLVSDSSYRFTNTKSIHRSYTNLFV